MRFDENYLRFIVKSIRERINITRLNLSGLKILTEAATGAYCVTPVIAAMAGAKEVIAYTKDSRFGNIRDVFEQTHQLINAVDSALPIRIISTISTEEYGKADIITNSGHLRPITREYIMAMKPTAVIPLMYENWEFRKGDVDLDACREKGIKVAGTNEHHRLLDVFSFLGPLVVKALHNIFIPVIDSKIVIVSNNAFGLPIAKHLSRNMANVFCVGPKEVFLGSDAVLCGDLKEADIPSNIDACVIATTPMVSNTKTYRRTDLTEFIVNICPTACVHVWGDIDYELLKKSDIFLVPAEPVKEGHQGLMMSDVGPEPIIRLQTGGLKVGEVLVRGSKDPFDLEFCQLVI